MQVLWLTACHYIHSATYRHKLLKARSSPWRSIHLSAMRNRKRSICNYRAEQDNQFRWTLKYLQHRWFNIEITLRLCSTPFIIYRVHNCDCTFVIKKRSKLKVNPTIAAICTEGLNWKFNTSSEFIHFPYYVQRKFLIYCSLRFRTCFVDTCTLICWEMGHRW